MPWTIRKLFSWATVQIFNLVNSCHATAVKVPSVLWAKSRWPPVADISSNLRSIERKQAPQCGVATIEIAEYGDRSSLFTLHSSNCHSERSRGISPPAGGWHELWNNSSRAKHSNYHIRGANISYWSVHPINISYPALAGYITFQNNTVVLKYIIPKECSAFFRPLPDP